MSESHDVRAIVAGHGSFAAGIISAVEQITGRGSVFVAVSNAGMCLDDIEDTLARELERTGARVLFTDLPAGSCTMAVRRMSRVRPGVVLVTGVNLSTLVDFAMQEGADPVADALAALERGRASMASHESPRESLAAAIAVTSRAAPSAAPSTAANAAPVAAPGVTKAES